MKKFLSILLSVVTLLSLLSLVGCGGKMKFGMGSTVYRDNVMNAKENTPGGIDTTLTVAAVLLDDQGKIADCAIDAIELAVKFDAQGKLLDLGDVKSKYEMGDSYGMKEYSKADKEWYQQVDSFVKLIKGKTITDIKALMTTEKKGNKEVVKAGCTIEIEDFIRAIENAVNNARETKAKKNSNIKVAMITEVSKFKDAAADAYGEALAEISFAATAIENGDKVKDVFLDEIEVSTKFDISGANTNTGDIVISKKSAKESYGMAEYGEDLNKDGKVLEWYKQAEVLEKAMKNKKSSEIDEMVSKNGYADKEVQKAGCTIKISTLAKVASKAAKSK